MASTLEEIDPALERWIARQPLFFVATAPLGADGHVNVSPKSPISTLAVLGPHEIAYLDLVGSGAETIAHLRENGRIVVMLCAFSGPPKIIRLHGRGEVLVPEDERFAELAERFGAAVSEAAHRSIVRIDVERIAKSCGYGVPLMEHVGAREHFDLSKRKRLRTMGPERLREFQAERNAESVDGLPAVPTD